jgi:hypothetical protein
LKIEVDSSDLEWGTLYKDEKCKELERVLQSDSRYAKCEVKRVYSGVENFDPFHVLDENGNGIVMLERWEVDALRGAELFTYIEVQRKRNQFTNSVEAVLLGMFLACIGLAVAHSVIGYFSQPSSPLATWFIVQNQGWFYLLALILGTLSLLKYRSTEQQKKNIDLEAARAEPSFRDVLQKLANQPETENPSKKKYVKRLENIEDASAGIQ